LTIYDNDMGRFPRKKSKYQSTGSVQYPTAPIPIELLSLDLSGPPTLAGTVPLPPPGSAATVHSFFDIFTELNVGGSGPQHIDSFFDITYRIGGGGGGGIDGTWPIEMFALEIKSLVNTPGGPVPVTIRESPTQASQGLDMMTSLPGGGVQIDSFFDVFTEISLDGGGSWHAGNAPLRMDLTAITPEPGTIALALFGLVGCGLMARRRR
jgi:hypothetical protein